MSQWLHISAHPLPSAGRRRPVTCPSHAGPLQHSLDAPTLQLDRRLRRSTLWRFYRSIRPSSSLPQTSLSLILRLSGSWEVQQTWLCEPDHRPSHRKVYGRTGGALWLTLTEIKDADKVSFLDAPISPSGLFGPAVKGFAERFTEAQKASQVMRHFLPSAPAQQLLRVALRLHRLSSPRSLHLPFLPLSLPRLSRHEGVHAQPDATPFRSVRAPDPR